MSEENKPIRIVIRPAPNQKVPDEVLTKLGNDMIGKLVMNPKKKIVAKINRFAIEDGALVCFADRLPALKEPAVYGVAS